MICALSAVPNVASEWAAAVARARFVAELGNAITSFSDGTVLPDCAEQISMVLSPEITVYFAEAAPTTGCEAELFAVSLSYSCKLAGELYPRIGRRVTLRRGR
jgi:hypothetical protein